MSRWQMGLVAPLVLFLSIGTAGSAEDAIDDAGNSALSSESPAELIRGMSLIELPPITPDEFDRMVRFRSAPTDLNRSLPASLSSSLGAAPVGPASIAELARALKNDPDLIYEYVRNNIEYDPLWGMQKGALGAILDRQGTAMDQVDLMVALLRQAGFTASYVKGRINLTGTQVRDWLGVDSGNVCGVGQVLTKGGIPFTSLLGVTTYSCPGTPVTMASVKLSHIWVKVNIGGTNYYFDPSYKPHTLKAGIDLATVSGYNAATYLTQAKSGATITADYIQGANRTNIRNNLNSYATTLTDYLRTNYPAGVLDDIVGGMTINPHTGGNLRQAALPYQDMSVPVVELSPTDLDNGYRSTLRVEFLSHGINVPLTSDAIYGKRLTITYNASNQPVLMLDGVVLATGTAITPGTLGSVRFTVTHPALSGANQNFTQTIMTGGTYLVGNGWGPGTRGVVNLHRKRLEEAKAAGSADTSEVVMGSSLAVLSATWIAQADIVTHIADRMARTKMMIYHRIGIAGYDTAAYVDLPGNKVGIASLDFDLAKEKTSFYSTSMHLSIFESTAVEQTSSVSAVSTTKLIDIAAANNYKIYGANAGNYATGTNIQNSLISCSTQDKAMFQSYISASYRLILPERCDLAEDSWTGIGFFGIADSGTSIGIAGVISGHLAGGFSSRPQLPAPYVNNTAVRTVSPAALTYTKAPSFNDPIDMVTGHFLYSNNDMNVGVGSYPHALTFQKIYSSGARTQAGPLGKGWSHNFASNVTVGSDGYQGMGEDSALDAVTTLVEQMVSLDLLDDPARPLDKMVIATLGHRWFGDQLLDNTVIVRQGLNGEVFVKLPDGSYNPPPGNPARLIKNVDTTYAYETLNRDKLNFNTAGKIATYNHASGLQVKFTYTGNDLTQVQNSLGRTLTLTNVSGRVTAVGDGTRSIGYAYDGNGNLATFTDATAKATTYQYDLPGRMTKLFYPINPTLAFVTNVYDTLGRVQTQTNVHSYLYTYYFAGSRSEEAGPSGVNKISYNEAFGKVIKLINPLGHATSNTYDGQERLAKTILPEGNSVTYVYDDATCAATDKRCTHNVKTLSKIPKSGSGLETLVTRMTYESAFNKVATLTDPKGFITYYSYTAQGDPFVISRPANIDGVHAYTAYGYTGYIVTGLPTFYLPTSITFNTIDSVNVANRTSYNSANKYVPLTATVDVGTGNLNLVTTYTYDTVGNLTVVNGPRTDVTDTVTTAYDNQRRPIQVIDALGKLTKFAYDADGNRIRSSAQIGTQWLVSCNTYTASGKLLKAWGPAQTAADTTCPAAAAPVAVTDYAYTVFDTPYRITENLTAGQGGNRITEYSYRLDESLYSASRATGTALAQVYATYTYTNNGLPASVKDAKNNLTTYQYDGHDRLSKTLFPDKATPNTSSATDYEQYDYDNNDNLVVTRKRNAQVVINNYDDLNRVTSRNYPNPDDNVTLRYDFRDRLTSAYTTGHGLGYLRDNAGRLAGVYLNGTQSLSYTYDPAGNRTRITWPEATPFYVTTAYDALNRPTSIKELGAASLATYAYDDLSRRTTVTLGNATTTTYTYSTQSALLTLTQNLAGTAQDNTWTYGRNQAQEITSHAWSNDAYQWTGYVNGTKAYAANGLNQYTAAVGVALGYDGNGNLSSYNTWTLATMPTTG